MKLRKVPKCRFFSGPYFPLFNQNSEKYRPEQALYLDTFHAVMKSCYLSQRSKYFPRLKHSYD